MLDRPARPPGHHWPLQPDVIGGMDEQAGGTWLAVSARGLVAAVLDRRGTLGPAAGKRSRGDLPLYALRAASAASAAKSIVRLDGSLWRGFCMIIADRKGAFYLHNGSGGMIVAERVTAGVHMVTSGALNDTACPRIARHLPRFRLAPTPSPPDWSYWQERLANTDGPADAAMSILPRAGFAMVSSALVAIPKTGIPAYWHANGMANKTEFDAVAISVEASRLDTAT